MVSYLPGTAPQYPMPAWVWSDEVLTAAARLLATVHRATRDFDHRHGVWRLPPREPVEVVCHNDFAPYNLVFDDRQVLTGVIDWDTASPGPRAWDVAYLAYRLVPLSDPANPDLVNNGLAERRRRLGLLCDAYGDLDAGAILVQAVDRLLEMAAFTAARAEAGETHVAGHVPLYVADAAWLAEHRTDLE